VLPDEEQHDSLKQLSAASGTVVPDELKESFLVVFPALHDVAVGVTTKESIDEDPVPVFAWETDGGSEPWELFKKSLIKICLSLALVDDLSNLGNCLF